MRMFNPDGSEGEMCGNALRSVGKYVYDHKLTDKTELVIRNTWWNAAFEPDCDGWISI